MLKAMARRCVPACAYTDRKRSGNRRLWIPDRMHGLQGQNATSVEGKTGRLCLSVLIRLWKQSGVSNSQHSSLQDKYLSETRCVQHRNTAKTFAESCTGYLMTRCTSRSTFVLSRLLRFG
nr:hypothetical protein CFP56_00271 [Quercus suber]